MWRDEMAAIPAEASKGDDEYLTSVVCPDCSGTLVVRREGPHFTFRCRIGHVYATPELLAAKEEKLEKHLWSAVAAMEEYASMLRDLGCGSERARRAKEDCVAVREIIERADPIQLDEAVDPERTTSRKAP